MRSRACDKLQITDTWFTQSEYKVLSPLSRAVVHVAVSII